MGALFAAPRVAGTDPSSHTPPQRQGLPAPADDERCHERGDREPHLQNVRGGARRRRGGAAGRGFRPGPRQGEERGPARSGWRVAAAASGHPGEQRKFGGRSEGSQRLWRWRLRGGTAVAVLAPLCWAGGVRAPSHLLPRLRSPPTSPTRCTPRCTWAPTTAATRWPARTRSGSCCRGARTTTWPTPWRRGRTGAKGPRRPGLAQTPIAGGGRGPGGSREPLYKCTNEGLLLFYVSSIITCIFPGTGPQRLSLPDPALVYFKSLYIGPPLPPSLPPTRGSSRCCGAGTVPRSLCRHQLTGADGDTRGYGSMGRREGGRLGSACTPSSRLRPPQPLQLLVSFPPQICCSPAPSFSCSLASANLPQRPLPTFFPIVSPPRLLQGAGTVAPPLPPALVWCGGSTAPRSGLLPAPRPLSNMHIF